MIHHLNWEWFVTVEWLLSSQPHWPRSYVAVSLGSRFRTPPAAWMSGQRNSGTRAEEKSVHARSSLFYPLKYIFPCFTHEIKFTFPQCIINFVLIFFPDWVVAKPAAAIGEGEVYNRVHPEAERNDGQSKCECPLPPFLPPNFLGRFGTLQNCRCTFCLCFDLLFYF